MRGLLSLLVILILAPIALGMAAPARAETTATTYVVIVNPKNQTTSVQRQWLSDAFLKKTTRWSGSVSIRPVDAKPAATSRKGFSKEVLKRSVSSVRSYWQQIIFSGRGTPPPEMSSDDEIVTYVLKHEGAIGYVSAEADLQGAKVVQVK